MKIGARNLGDEHVFVYYAFMVWVLFPLGWWGSPGLRHGPVNETVLWMLRLLRFLVWLDL